jgi:hypothetical protein
MNPIVAFETYIEDDSSLLEDSLSSDVKDFFENYLTASFKDLSVSSSYIISSYIRATTF